MWDDGPGDGDPAGWIKQVSLVRRRPDIGADEFATRYRAHGPVARAHHGMFRYAQSTAGRAASTASIDDDERVDGISELWFRDRADWRDGFYLQRRQRRGGACRHRDVHRLRHHPLGDRDGMAGDGAAP